MADKQIKQYTEYTTPVAGDWFLSQKASTDETVKVAAENVVPDGAVTPEKILAGTGTTWAWTSWTPTWTNCTIGNATVVAAYKQVGKTVVARIQFTFGSTTSFSGGPLFSLPVTANAVYSIGTPVGPVYVEDNGVTGFEGNLRLASTTTCNSVILNTTGTYGTSSGITATIPFTWATGDFFRGTLVYEAA